MSGLIPNVFTLRCEGQDWQGWKSLSVKQSLDNAVHSFSMDTTDRNLDLIGKWNVRGGSQIDILIDGHRVFSGYVQKYGVKLGASDHSITIEGSSRSIDAVECSHLGPYFWKGAKPEAIVSDVLKPFGFSATFDRPLSALPKEGFKVEVETPPFEILKKLAERDGLTVITDVNGVFRFYDGKSADEAGHIGRGDYVDLSADHDLSQAFSEIIVKAQTNDRTKPSRSGFTASQRHETRIKNGLKTGGAHGKNRQREKTSQIGGPSARQNPSPLRYRPIVYVQNGEADAAKAFAEFARARFTGDVITASLTVKSHLNPKGALWQVGQLVWLDEPLLSVNQWLLVSDVEFKLDSGGYETVIGLKVPNTYDPLAKPMGAAVRAADGEFGNALRAAG